jgi:hypothetical protein
MNAELETQLAEDREALESEVSARAREFRQHKLVHRWVKLGLGWLAVVTGAIATATAFDNNPEVAAWAALVTTILVGWQTWQNPADKEADHQGREASCRHLQRQVHYLRLLPQDPGTYEDRVGKLAGYSEQLREISERPWVR